MWHVAQSEFHQRDWATIYTLLHGNPTLHDCGSRLAASVSDLELEVLRAGIREAKKDVNLISTADIQY